ncbi:ribonuclease [Bifidobacterium callimiconis]|uniref:Ribonuclease n=1 Tax=Bifidobacterium callimiconis TaxID=2306973 RepID=A0A430FIR7_9BIFI|nr:ribonuclease [Bifidobacterium callimiconis]RSX52671.1 ribonuclease [Bifidobacterium callimiconis]
MSNEKHLLLWMDVETTGLDPAAGCLLEIGLMVTSMDGERTLGSLQEVIHPCDGVRVTGVDQLRAIRMHMDNNLLAQAFATATSLSQAAADCDGFIHEPAWASAVLHPAGTNPDFDLRWIRAKLAVYRPSLLDGVSYRKLDLTGLRLAQLALGHDPYPHHQPGTHRVHDCLTRDLADYQAIIATMHKETLQ